MPAITGQGRIYNAAAIVDGTALGSEYAIELKPNPRSSDTTQQAWAGISWSNLGAGTLIVNVYNLAKPTTPASASREKQLVATSGSVSAASGSLLKFIEVAGPNMIVETVVAGGGVPNVTVNLESTSNVTVTVQ